MLTHEQQAGCDHDGAGPRAQDDLRQPRRGIGTWDPRQSRQWAVGGPGPHTRASHPLSVVCPCWWLIQINSNIKNKTRYYCIYLIRIWIGALLFLAAAFAPALCMHGIAGSCWQKFWKPKIQIIVLLVSNDCWHDTGHLDTWACGHVITCPGVRLHATNHVPTMTRTFGSNWFFVKLWNTSILREINNNPH